MKLVSRLAAVTVASAAIVGVLAIPASAVFYGNTIEVGYIHTDSYCSNTASLCKIKLTYGSSTRWAYPPKTGLVFGGTRCPNGASGLHIGSAINNDRLNGEYASVIFGGSGAQGAINCK